MHLFKNNDKQFFDLAILVSIGIKRKQQLQTFAWTT